MFAGTNRAKFWKKKNRQMRNTGVVSAYAAHRRHFCPNTQPSAHSAAQTSPQRIAGVRLAPFPDNPASTVTGAAGVGARPGTVVGGGRSSTEPTSAATTIRRFVAVYLGVQVVNVRRLSLVGASTSTSPGSTSVDDVTRYSKGRDAPLV